MTNHTESLLKSRIEDLLEKRKDQIISELSQIHKLRENELIYVHDGFFPYYTEQKIKILFIARESFQMEQGHYIETVCDQLQKGIVRSNDYSKGKSIDNDQFFSTLLYIAYSILNGFPSYKDLGYASTFYNSFAKENGFSFAFMNLSKISNWSNNWRANWLMIDSFLNTDQGVTKEEIELLEPDIIITMNLGKERLKKIGSVYTSYYDGISSLWHWQSENSQSIPLIDTYHFSAPGKQAIIVNSVINLVKEILKNEEKA